MNFDSPEFMKSMEEALEKRRESALDKAICVAVGFAFSTGHLAASLWLWSVILKSLVGWFLLDIPFFSGLAGLSGWQYVGLSIVLRFFWRSAPDRDHYFNDKMEKKTAKQRLATMMGLMISYYFHVLALWGIAWIIHTLGPWT